jgi:hypothetical protein
MSRFAFWCLIFALPAAAQLDSNTLRAKYGAPLSRETYHLPQGFDLTVDYGAANQVCKLEVPAEMPPQANASGPFNPRQQMQDFLAELVPNSMRGKELGRLINYQGAVSDSVIQYEHVTMSEIRYANGLARGQTITVMITNDGCHFRAGQ